MLSRIIILIPIMLLLNSCFFIFIPGSVISAIGDAVTGSEGTNCVGVTAKVGDRINKPNGTVGVIQSLSGSSMRCTQPEFPIRAQIGPASASRSDANAATLRESSYKTSLRLILPPLWETKPLTDTLVANGWSLSAVNKMTDSGLIFTGVRKDGITDLKNFAISKRAALISNKDSYILSDIIESDLNGKISYRFEIPVILKDGHKITYNILFVDEITEVAILYSWTSTPNYDQQKGQLNDLAKFIR